MDNFKDCYHVHPSTYVQKTGGKVKCNKSINKFNSGS